MSKNVLSLYILTNYTLKRTSKLASNYFKVRTDKDSLIFEQVMLIRPIANHYTAHPPFCNIQPTAAVYFCII